VAPTVYRQSLPVRDPHWTLSDYLRLAQHRSSRVRFWALDRMEELELDIPADCLSSRLDDADGSVAATAARLIGDREVAALADDLLARVTRAEDAVGATCALSLVHLGDRRFVEALCARRNVAPADRDPRIWQALSLARTPEATDLIRQALAALPPRGAPSIAAGIGAALAVADPPTGVPLAVESVAGGGGRGGGRPPPGVAAVPARIPRRGTAIAGRHALRGRVGRCRDGRGNPGCPGGNVPAWAVGELRGACRRGKWARAIETIASLADALVTRMPSGEHDGFALSLARTLGARGKRFAGSGGKGQDAVGLGLLALQT
jgi:hypothetical protein